MKAFPVIKIAGMKASIIICTRNRAQDLKQTLRSLGGVTVSQALLPGAEVIVVDNGSTDETAEVVRACALPNMPVCYICEPQSGQARARNTGMQKATGEVIVFTDDDMRFPSDWLEKMCAPILSGETDAVGGGIRLAPHLERAWMQDMHRLHLADTTALRQRHDQSPLMIGANMAFARRLFPQLQFDTELGPGALGFWDDVLFYLQLQEAGYRLLTALEVEVEHHCQESRLLPASFRDRARKEGASRAYVAYHWWHEVAWRPQLQIARAILKLARLRFINGVRREDVTIEEMETLSNLSFYLQYLQEKRRPRNYVKRGLAKCNAEPQPQCV